MLLPRNYQTNSYSLIATGLPLLYVGGLTVPLGFARSKEIRMHQYYDYGYEQAWVGAILSWLVDLLAYFHTPMQLLFEPWKVIYLDIYSSSDTDHSG